ncbi:MAG: AP2 domain-containing protein [Candidatus Adiutrix sp.]|jgi:hypothetical protein|nr:AP2 domain-containing protein [Candidatus Adiutrix sp.]
MLALQLEGKVFKRLTVIKRLENTIQGQSRWLCQCSCGNTTNTVGAKLTSGKTVSCGCLGLENATKAKVKHGDAPFRKEHPKLYRIWCAMRNRCSNPNRSNYQYYGGKGVTVCPEWHDYAAFKTWALANGYADDLEIDRIDSGGDYSPDNCQWITGFENKSRAHRRA